MNFKMLLSSLFSFSPPSTMASLFVGSTEDSSYSSVYSKTKKIDMDYSPVFARAFAAQKAT